MFYNLMLVIIMRPAFKKTLIRSINICLAILFMVIIICNGNILLYEGNSQFLSMHRFQGDSEIQGADYQTTCLKE